jgi:hypothetical protein
VSPASSLQPTDRELPDRGAAPFAPDFVADAIDLTRGSIGLRGSGGGFVAATALTAVLSAVTLLATAAHVSPAPTARCGCGCSAKSGA